MGPCTSTSKSHQKPAKTPKPTPVPDSQPPNKIFFQDARGNMERTASTDDKHASLDQKHASNGKNNENCEGDHTLQITPASQNCLRSVQNKKFLSFVNGPNTIKVNSEQMINAANSIPADREQPASRRRKSGGDSDGGNLVSKRPNFQKQIEKKKINLNITLKGKPRKKTS